MDQPLGSYLKTHRKNAGLTQTELATLIGFPSVTSVSNHERLRTVPTLMTAIAYEVVFQVPIAEIFPGVTEAVEHVIDRNLLEFEAGLKERATVSDRGATSRKLDWISDRRSVVRRV